MAALDIPQIYKEKAVLIADDEPEHLEWRVDFLEALGLTVTLAVNVEEAMAASQKTWYRIYIIDLNIPLGGWPEPSTAIFSNYPGFAIIQGIRTQGNDGRRVIAYSAHSNELITSEMKRLYTDFIAKGRPLQLKERLKELLLEPDQTAATLARVNAWNARRTAAAAARRVAAKSAKPKARPRPATKKAPVRTPLGFGRSTKPKLKKTTKAPR